MKQAFTERIASASGRLRTKVQAIDPAGLAVSDYTRHHLSEKLTRLDHFLGVYADVLSLVLIDQAPPPDRFVLVDYGGGTGLMSLLARELGVGTVIYNDIDDVACADMAVLSKEVGLPPDDICCGDLDALAGRLRAEGRSVDGVASYDVLEHIYDVETHLRGLGSLSDEPFRGVYASSANTRNPRIVSAIEALQWEAEHEDRRAELAAAERGTSRSYLQVRREIIAAAAPDLGKPEIDRLARATRGLVEDDIRAAVAEYRSTGSLGYRPAHATNTCDPYTGDWRERLLRLERLVEIAREAGYDARIHAGTYSITGPPAMKVLKQVTNAVIRILDRRALLVAPYYVLEVHVSPPNRPSGHEPRRGVH